MRDALRGRNPSGTGYPPTVRKGAMALELYRGLEWFFRVLTRIVKLVYREALALVRVLGKRLGR